jgi:hypothetical protein
MSDIVTAVMFILAGSVFLFLGIRLGYTNWRRDRESRKWPAIPGRATSSEVTIETGLDTKTYQARVQYEYVVLDKTYSGSRISESIRHTPMQRMIEQYAPGIAVEVYYDPKQPGASALEPLSPSLFMPAAGVVVGLFSLYVGMLLTLNLLPRITLSRIHMTRPEGSHHRYEGWRALSG